MNFKLTHVVVNKGLTDVIANRVKDLAPAFDRIIDEWQIGNQVKFDNAVGMQDVGVDQGEGIFWEPVTPDYSASKYAAGYEDHLMVREGDLLLDLTMGRNNYNWFENIEPQEAIFGSINPKIGWNWEKRPTQFLNRQDRIMISSEVKMYLDGRGRYGEMEMGNKTFRQTRDEFENDFDWDIGD